MTPIASYAIGREGWTVRSKPGIPIMLSRNPLVPSIRGLTRGQQRIMKPTTAVCGCVVAMIGLTITLSLFGQSRRGGIIHPFPVLAALDADGNGELSSAEIQEATAALKTLDTNQDGRLTQSEWRPAIGIEGGPGDRRPQNRSGAPFTQPSTPLPPLAEKIEGVSTGEILQQFGAKGRAGTTERQLANYRRVFGFTDTDQDGQHSQEEYIENGTYLTPRSRRGIFQASDSNKDGFVSEAEYVENRLITDEAKLIFNEMDANGDSKLTERELLDSGKLNDRRLASGVFKALDTNGNGELIIPEYLRVWGRWARH